MWKTVRPLPPSGGNPRTDPQLRGGRAMSKTGSHMLLKPVATSDEDEEDDVHEDDIVKAEQSLCPDGKPKPNPPTMLSGQTWCLSCSVRREEGGGWCDGCNQLSSNEHTGSNTGEAKPPLAAKNQAGSLQRRLVHHPSYPFLRAAVPWSLLAVWSPRSGWYLVSQHCLVLRGAWLSSGQPQV